MSVRELLQTAYEAGIELRADGDLLRYRAPPGALTAALRAELTAARSDLLLTLRADAAAIDRLRQLLAPKADLAEKNK